MKKLIVVKAVLASLMTVAAISAAVALTRADEAYACIPGVNCRTAPAPTGGGHGHR